MQRSSVLVTGGGVYIGSHVCKALDDAGYLPVTYDDFSSGHRWAVQWGPCVEGKLQDVDLLKDTFNRFTPQAVIHMAASIQVRESMIDPLHYYANNIGG